MNLYSTTILICRKLKPKLIEVKMLFNYWNIYEADIEFYFSFYQALLFVRMMLLTVASSSEKESCILVENVNAIRFLDGFSVV